MTHCIEWSLKMKIKNEISKVEKLKSENQKKNHKSKNVQKILSVRFFQHLEFLSTEMRKSSSHDQVSDFPYKKNPKGILPKISKFSIEFLGETKPSQTSGLPPLDS